MTTHYKPNYVCSTSQGALAQGFAQMLFLFTSQAINEAYPRAIIILCPSGKVSCTSSITATMDHNRTYPMMREICVQNYIIF